MSTEWNDILTNPPEQGQRILVRLIGGQTRLATYDRFDYACWAIKDWKPVPSDNGYKR